MAARFCAPRKGYNKSLSVALVLLSFLAGSAIASANVFLNFDPEGAEKVFVSKSDGSYHSLEDAYLAVSSLKALKKDVTDAEKTCKWLKRAVGKAASGKDIFHASSVSVELGCHLESLAKDNLSSLSKEIENAADIPSLYYPLAALALAKRQGWLAEGSVSAATLTTATKHLKELAVLSAGPYNLGLGGDIAASILALGGEELEDIKLWTHNILGTALKEAKNGGGSLYFDESADASSIAITSSVLRGLVSLLSTDPSVMELDKAWVMGFTSFLLSRGLPSSPTEVFYLLKGLHVASENSYFVPVYFKLKRPTVSILLKEKLEVIVGTALGAPVPKAKVTLVSATAVGKSKALHSNAELVRSSDGTTYSLDFLTGSVDMGTFDIKLEVKAENSAGDLYEAVDSPKNLRIRATNKVSVSKAKLFVLEDDESSAFKTNLKFGEPAPASISATHLQKLKLSFKLESGGAPFKAQQVFFKLIHKETGTPHVYACKWSDKSYSLTLNLLEMMEKLYYLSGPYSMELVVGDVLLENSFVWDLGTVDLDLESNPDSTKRPPKIVAPEERFLPMKEIEHIMRIPDKRPSQAISYLFTLLVLVPFVIFLVALSRLGVNFKAFPSGGGALLASVGFHGGIAALLGLYFLYWLKLDIFTTFKFLFFLSVFTATSGYHALSYLANSSSKVKVA